MIAETVIYIVKKILPDVLGDEIFYFPQLKTTRSSRSEGDADHGRCCCASLVGIWRGLEQGFVRARTITKCSHRHLQPMASDRVTGNIKLIKRD